MHKKTLLGLCIMFLTAGLGYGADLSGWPDPGFDYLYDGDALTLGTGCDPAMRLDGTWHRCPSSDEWDGEGLGPYVGDVGGMDLVTVDGRTALRIVDPQTSGGSCNNRKQSSAHDLADEGVSGALLDDGVTLVFSMRVVPAIELYGYDVAEGTTDPLDYTFQGNTKGGPVYIASTAGAANQMLNFTILNGHLLGAASGETTGQIDIDLVADYGYQNGDWVTVWATCQAGAGGNYVEVYVNGEIFPSFRGEVTLSGQSEKLRLADDSGDYTAANYMTIELEQTGGTGAFDFDYVGYKAGVTPPRAGDCFVFDETHDINTPTAGSTVCNGDGSLTIQSSGADIWGGSDQFRYTYLRDIPGNWVMAAKLDMTGAPHAWAKAGIMARNAITPESEFVSVNGTGNNGEVGQHRRVAGNGGTTWGSNRRNWADPDNGYVALERMGDTLYGYISNDGVEWWRAFKQSAAEGDCPWLGETVNVGLSLTSHDGSNLATVVFSEISFLQLGAVSYPSNVACTEDAGNVVVTWDAPSILPEGIAILRNGELIAELAPDAASFSEPLPDDYTRYDVKSISGTFLGGRAWSSIGCKTPIQLESMDIAADLNGNWVGSTTTDNCQTYEILAAGADIWGSADRFRYAYVPGGVQGDFLMAAHVDAGEAPGTWGRHGVMMRAHMDRSSRHWTMCLANGQRNAHLEVRSTDGGGVGHVGGGQGVNSPSSPLAWEGWMAVARVGTTGFGYWSADGVTWQEHASGPQDVSSLPPTVQVGLCTHSWEAHINGKGKLKPVTFDQIILATCPQNFTCSSTVTDVNMSWELPGNMPPVEIKIFRGDTEIASLSGSETSVTLVDEVQPVLTQYVAQAIYELPTGTLPLTSQICTIAPPVDLRPLSILTIGNRNAHGCALTNAWDPNVVLDDDTSNHWDNWNNTVYTGEDWIGLEFRGPNGELNVRQLYQFDFMEGPQFGDGGPFEWARLEILKDGKWVDSGIGGYTGANGTGDELFQFALNDVAVAGVRMYGKPWGSRSFISCRKLAGYVRKSLGEHPTVNVSVPEAAEYGEVITANAFIGDAEGPASIIGWDLNADDPLQLVRAGADSPALPMTTCGKVTVSCYVQDVDGNISIGQADIIVGAPTSIVVNENHFDSAGFIKTWLILGPLSQGQSANPPVEDMRRDYLTDGFAITEDNILPYDGQAIEIDFNAAHSTGLKCDAWPDINPGGVPTFFVHKDSDDSINHWYSVPNRANNDSVFGGNDGLGGNDPNDMMVYHCIYVRNNTGEEIEATVAGASDDSLQVIVNGVEAICHSIPRGYGGTHNVQDRGDCVLFPGTNLVMAKVWEGGGGSGLRLRLEERGNEVPLMEPDISIVGVPNAPSLHITEEAEEGFLRFTCDSDADIIFWDLNAADGIQADVEGAVLEITTDFPAARGFYNVTCVAANDGGTKGSGNPVWAGTTYATTSFDNTAIDVEPPAAPVLPLPFHAKYFAYVQKIAGTIGAAYEVLEPAGATVSADGRVEYVMNQRGVVHFAVKAINPFGSDTVEWDIMVYDGDLCDDFDDDPLANPLWQLEDPNPGTVFSTADSMFTMDQPPTGDSGDFDNWCGFTRTPMLWYPVDCLMDFSIEIKMDVTRVDPATGAPVAAPGNWASHHGIIMDIPDRSLSMYGFIRDRIRGEHCTGPFWTDDGELAGALGEFPWEGSFRIEKKGTAGQYYFKYKLADSNPWTLDHTFNETLQPTRAGIFTKNWGGAGAPASVTNFHYACLKGVLYPPENIACTVEGDAVTVTWDIPQGALWETVTIMRNGEEIASVASDATSYTDATPPWPEGLQSMDYTINVVNVDGHTGSVGCSATHISEYYIVYQNGAYPSPNYQGCSDAHIIYHRSDQGEFNSGAHDALEEGDWNGGHGDHKEILIQFDIPELSSLNIEKAELRMWYWYCRSGQNIEHKSFANPVKKEWNAGNGTGVDGRAAEAGEVTWQSAKFGESAWQDWSEYMPDTCDLPVERSGGVYGPDDIISMNIESNEAYGTNQKWVAWDITAVAQAWTQGTIPNNGLKITQTGDGNYTPCFDYIAGGYDFVSSNHGSMWARPMLIIKYRPFTAPQDISCAVDGHSATVSWTNNDSYDSLTLSGAPGGDISLAPGAESYTVTDLTCGSYTFTLTAVKGDNTSDLSCEAGIDVAGPQPADPCSVVTENDVTVSWINNDDYDAIEVSIDGGDPVSVANDATSFSAEDLSVGDHTITIVASQADCVCTPIECTFTIEEAPRKFIRGDVNDDAVVNIADAVKMLMYLFAGDQIGCLDAADANDDESVNISDVSAILSSLFGGTGNLPAPNTCGVDPTPGDPDLGCDFYDNCDQGW